MPEQTVSRGGTSRPPQFITALSAAGGGFGGALLAIIVAKILAGPCCCQGNTTADVQYKATESAATVQPQRKRISAAG